MVRYFSPIVLLVLFLSIPLWANKPNVLIIMADDLGAEALACYGNSAYTTPRLDRMASEGARFENAFATPVCSPTRAMILTGLYPNRIGIMERMDSRLDPDNNNRLPAHIKTIGHMFQEAGYATAIAGKWHLGDFQRYPDQPTSHGFDEHCLWVQHWDGKRPSRYYGPHNWENGEFRAHSKEVYGPDLYCDFLLDFIERNRELPFFAYFPMNLIHGPLIEPPALQELAASSFPDDLGAKEQTIGHMITYMDAIVGRMLDKLAALGLEEETLVIFTGDNGSAPNLISQLGSLRIRGGKRSMNEAGTRVPLIARWPGKIPSGTRNAFFTLMDVMPTLAKVAGLPINHEIDGMDLSHNLFNTPGKDRTLFAMAFEGGVYFVRDKRFRLHEDGRFYKIPVSDLEARYSMGTLPDGINLEYRQRLQSHLDAFMYIKQTDTSYAIIPFGTYGDAIKNRMDAENAARE